jgi:probable phosphomutase (TIGR03848 family)
MARAPKPPSSTLVLFVRHGRTPTTGRVLPGRTPGLHLSEDGLLQAKHAAERIAALPRVAAVYTSPLERTRETSTPIARALGLRSRTHSGLLECDFGEWTGVDLKTLRRRAEWKTIQRYPAGFRFPGGESFAEMQARMNATVDTLVRRHPGHTVVAVSHADLIKAALATAIGTPLDLFQRILVSPGSISAVAYGASGPLVLCVNNVGADLPALNVS